MMEIPAKLIMAPPSPTNYLACREHYQVTKYKLRRTEDELMRLFEAKTLADLELAIAHERAKPSPRHLELIKLYDQQHIDFAAADELFDIAQTIQKQRIAEPTPIS